MKNLYFLLLFGLIYCIDIGSIGDWGEGHTHFSSKVPPTFAEVKANIDVYLKIFGFVEMGQVKI